MVGRRILLLFLISFVSTRSIGKLNFCRFHEVVR